MIVLFKDFGQKISTPLGLKIHQALQGRTPAEASMIEIDGKNKWKTIIQNASLYKENSI